MKNTILFPALALLLITLMLSCNDDHSGVNPGPAITGVSPDSGYAGDAVTIDANGVVPQAEENIVRFNGTRAQITSAKLGQILTRVPSGAASGVVTLQVDGQTAKGPFFRVLIPAPTITSVVPASGPPGTLVTITGTNFGGAPAASGAAGSAAPPLPGTAASKSTAAPVKIQPQVLHKPALRGSKPPSAAPAVTTGQAGPLKSGRADTTAAQQQTSNITVTVGGVEAIIISRTSTQIVIKIPPEAADGPIIIIVDGKSVNSGDFDIIFDVVTPEITGIAPTSGMPGTAVTITGENFGATPDDNIVAFNGTEAAISSAGENEIVATVPDEATTGPVTVTTNGQTATGPAFTVQHNQAPSITSDASFEVAENTTTVGTVTASDPNGDTLTYSLSGGDDQALFAINATSGALTFKAAPDFEAPADANTDNKYQVQVQVSDGSKTATQEVTISVTDVDENQAPSITSGASFSVAENTAAVGTVTASDPNGDTLTYSLSGGDDQALFAIDAASGALTFKTAPDFEAPADANTDNKYQVQVQVSDGSENASQNLTINISNLNDTAPSITSGTAFTATEGQTAVTTVTATDADGSTLTFSITGGVDAADFTISSSGALSFASAPDPDNPADSDTNNEYIVQVQVSDGSATDSQTLTITVPLYAGGDGSSGSPYQVATLAQLQRVQDNPAASYRQTANIDASATATMDGGAGFVPIYNFSGSYDGDGFTISGLTINRPGTNYVGLFGFINYGASVTGVALTGVDITGRDEVGGLVGFIRGSTITGASISGSVTGSTSVGGLVGKSESDIITRSFATSNVTGGTSVGGLVGYNYSGNISYSYATGSINGNNYTGGLVGVQKGGTIESSHARGNVTSTGGIAGGTGGLVGYADSPISNSYARGAVTGTTYVGGLVGDGATIRITNCYATGSVSSVSGSADVGGLSAADEANANPPIITNSYWDTEATGQNASAGGGTGLKTAKMQGSAAQTNMTGFDFPNVWMIQTGPDGYPILHGVGGQ